MQIVSFAFPRKQLAMRLLRVQTDGSFSLTKDLIENIPPYAILSHTWGDDDQEVDFHDIQHYAGQHKQGYKKLQFCCQQTASDGLQYFWVDTSCIDKSNNTELSEAINSMFHWYQNSTYCYVYLSDVSKIDREDGEASRASWKLSLRNSRWFTRGWTLQELIAPKSVTFFSAERQRLGDKASLETLLHEITGIPIDVLQGNPLCNFGIQERFSWLGNRKTKRVEDRAYSLFGIFDVHLPLIYGEGEKKAFIRLNQEVGKQETSGCSPAPSI
jgi:hypothetical protein